MKHIDSDRETSVTRRQFFEEHVAASRTPKNGGRVISVIIPARNEATNHPNTLTYLKQCIPDKAMEIIVAEGGSEGGNTDVARPLE